MSLSLHILLLIIDSTMANRNQSPVDEQASSLSRERSVVEQGHKIKQEPDGAVDEIDLVRGFDKVGTISHLDQSPANQALFPTRPSLPPPSHFNGTHQIPTMPSYHQPSPVLQGFREHEWWKDMMGQDEIMMATVMTLEGCKTSTISTQLKRGMAMSTRFDLEKPHVLYDMQRTMRDLFKSRDMPKVLMPFVADGLTRAFLAWCNGPAAGLRVLAQAKEVDNLGPHPTPRQQRESLRDLARTRRNNGLNICEQFGYTAEWADRRIKEGIWTKLLLEWWSKGTINGVAIPETGN